MKVQTRPRPKLRYRDLKPGMRVFLNGLEEHEYLVTANTREDSTAWEAWEYQCRELIHIDNGTSLWVDDFASDNFPVMYPEAFRRWQI